MMEFWNEYWPWIIFAAVVLLVIIVKGRPNMIGGAQIPNQPMNRQPQFPASKRVNSLSELKELARTDKIEAIKIYRQRTDAGLKDAMEAIDRLLTGEEIPWFELSSEQVISSTPNFDNMDEMELLLEIQPSLKSGNLIEAIKVTREKTGWSLLDAKNWVEKQVQEKN